MPGPVGSDAHVDALLTNMSIGYRNASYIADQLFPIVTVQKQSDILPKYDKSPWFRDSAALRAPGTKSRGGGFSVDKTDTYFAHRYSFRYEIADPDRKNTDRPFDLDVDGMEFVVDKLQMRRERAFAGDFFLTGTWTTDVDGGVDFTQWSDFGLSTPIVDIDSYKDAVEALIGREPNKLAMGKQVWLQLKNHPDLIDAIKYTQRGQITAEIAASLFEIEQMLIGRAIYTTSPEGTAEASVTYTRIWGKHALLMYVPGRPSLKTPAAGYTFVWNEAQGGGAIQWIKRMRDEEREVDIIEGNSNFDQKQTGAAAGAFMENAVS